jgi:hypothetical protein
LLKFGVRLSHNLSGFDISFRDSKSSRRFRFRNRYIIFVRGGFDHNAFV